MLKMPNKRKLLNGKLTVKINSICICKTNNINISLKIANNTNWIKADELKTKIC